jgi:hypothetical protein
MSTANYIVRPDRGWMSVSAWMEMVGSVPSTRGSPPSPSSSTLMLNRCLHTSLCPYVKKSS